MFNNITLKKILNKISIFIFFSIGKFYEYLFLPIFYLIAFILYFLNIRFINILWVNAIGHICLETEMFLREKYLKNIKYKCIILLPNKQVANKHIVNYFKNFFFIFSNDIICFLLQPFKNIKFINHDINNYIMNLWSASLHHEIMSRTANYKPHYTLKEEDKIFGYENLKKFGIEEHDWFITIHSRDSFYRDGGKANHRTSVRDSNIETYIKMIKYIVSLNGFVIRMGSNKCKALSYKHTNVIDYALSNIRSDRMDVFLAAKSKIFIGTNSGLFALPLIFGTPILFLNLIPLAQLNCQPFSIGVPKILRNKKDKKILSFLEAFKEPMGNSFYTEDFENANLEIIDNDQDLIYEATIEALQRIEGKFNETPEDIILQKKFKKLLKPHHYGYKTAGFISTTFLRKYKNLL